MPVDDSIIESKRIALQSKADALAVQLGQIRMIIRNLDKVHSIQTGVDMSTGTPIPILASPPDPDMGNVPMDAAKRQAIYDVNIALADKILGIPN